MDAKKLYDLEMPMRFMVDLEMPTRFMVVLLQDWLDRSNGSEPSQVALRRLARAAVEATVELVREVKAVGGGRSQAQEDGE